LPLLAGSNTKSIFRMNAAEGIFTIPDFLPAIECDAFIRMSEKEGYGKASLATVDGPKIQSEVRNNDRVIVDDAQMAADLWRRAAPHIPRILNGRQALGLNERFRFYRYDPGQQFAGHIDAPFRRENGEVSQLTFMIYLNDDFQGGETKFDDVSIKPRRGMALVFRHDLFHEGSKIEAGRKYVMRSDVMYNPPGRFTGG
jgi:prolyl 4-hydroxylase